MNFTSILLMSSILSSCYSQHSGQSNYQLVGGPCEGCEAIFEYGARLLNSIDTLPDFNDPGQKIRISGIVYQEDGKTPAADVILYVYHTNQDGIYPAEEGMKGWARRHGYIRGWVRTNKEGRYTFYTLKPGFYPNRSTPAHIHPTILEPNGKYYWLGSYHFNGDPFLTAKEIDPVEPRGGSSGLLKLTKEENLLAGKRDFIMGKNIPDYK